MQSRITFFNRRRGRTMSHTQTVETKQEHDARCFRFKNGRDVYLGAMLVMSRPGRLPVTGCEQ